MINYKISYKRVGLNHKLILRKRVLFFYLKYLIYTEPYNFKHAVRDKLEVWCKEFNVSKENVKNYEALKMG